jgi:hypothetical protein
MRLQAVRHESRRRILSGKLHKTPDQVNQG